MAEAAARQDFSRDFASGATYVKISDPAVARTARIEDKGELFLADYDADGDVRGVEFLGSRRNGIEHYRALAACSGKGAAVGSGPREPRA